MKELEDKIFKCDAAIEEAEKLFVKKDDVLSFSFDNILEYYIYNAVYPPKKPLEPTEIPFSTLYKAKAQIYLDYEKVKDATIWAKKACDWNPCDTDAIFLLGECYKRSKELHRFLNQTRQAMTVAYTKSDLARAYRNWGYFFIETKQYEKAAQLYFFSYGFEENENVLNELLYINQMTGKEVAKPNQDELLNIFKEHKIQMGPSQQIIDLFPPLIKMCKDENMDELAQNITALAADITGDPQYMPAGVKTELDPKDIEKAINEQNK